MYMWSLSGKESIMEMVLDICNRIYEIASYDMRRVCFKIEKSSMNNPPYTQIRLFTAKKNEGLKQVAYVNSTLNDFKEISQN